MAKLFQQSDATTDALKFAEELLKKTEYSINAIRSRNIRIKELRAEIYHRKVVFDEMQKRMQVLVDSSENIKTLQKAYDILVSKNEELTKQLEDANAHKAKLKSYIESMHREIIVRDNQNYIKRFSDWAERICKFLPALPKSIATSLLTTPGLYWSIAFILCLLITASFIGWAPIISLFKTISSLWS